jgi:hypothetical protein
MKTMRALTKGLVSVGLLAAVFAVGCGSSSDNGDGGPDGGGGTGGANPCPGLTLHGLTDGDSCFDILGASAVVDGCNLGVGDTTAMMGLVGASLPVHYDAMTGMLSVGTQGSLGASSTALQCNMGTLSRQGMPTLDSMPACTWSQSDNSTVTITAQNEFDISVTEMQSGFTGCSAANMPASGMCTSTWTWHMKIGTKAPPCQ